MKKNTIVLDTSVIAFDPHCLDAFPKSNIVLHVGVLTELDKIKKFGNEAGKNARYFIRLIDKIAKDKEGTSYQLENGSTLIIDVSKGDASYLGDNSYEDNHLINCARIISQNNLQYGSGSKVILVSRDINLRMRAKAYGITAQDYDDATKNKDSEESYTGIIYINSPELGAKLYDKNGLAVEDSELLRGIYPNECVVFEDEERNVVALGREKKGKIIQVKDHTLWGIKSKNKEQAFANELLMDPDIPLVSLIGAAGTGKTLLSIAAGMEQVIEKGKYESLLVYRPMIAVGESVGYLPGDLESKLSPWMAAITDSLEFIVNAKKKKSKNAKADETWKDKLGQFADLIHLEAISFVRGRSIPNTFIVLDESQNCSISDMKTILTRVSAGTKIVITGDVQQVDSGHMDSMNNGLAKVADVFKHSEFASHLTLSKGERSGLATEAARLL